MADRERQRQFEAMLREHQRIVFKVAGAYANSAHDRDDLAQEIAAQLWRSFGALWVTHLQPLNLLVCGLLVHAVLHAQLVLDEIARFERE